MNNKCMMITGLCLSATLVSASDKAQGQGAAGFILPLTILILFVLASTLLYILLGSIKKYRDAEKKLKEAQEKITALESSVSETQKEKDELNIKIRDLQRTVERDGKTISGLRETLHSDSFDGRFPICAHCKDIRDEKGFWHPIEEYLQNLSPADFSHSLCPNCAKELYPDLFKDGNKPHTLTWK